MSYYLIAPDGSTFGPGAPAEAALELCELCGEVAPLNPASICNTCHKQGVEHLEEGRARYATNEAEEIAWARSIGWLP